MTVMQTQPAPETLSLDPEQAERIAQETDGLAEILAVLLNDSK